MPRKVDPTAVTVLQYFETAPIEAAELVLQLAKAVIVKRRAPEPSRVKPASRPRASVPAASQVVAPPIQLPDPKAPPAVTPAKPRSRRMHAAPSSQELDVPLPGLPGPVPVVGG